MGKRPFLPAFSGYSPPPAGSNRKSAERVCFYVETPRSSGDFFGDFFEKRLIIFEGHRKMSRNLLGVSAHSKAAIVGEIAVPCTCNPLQQG